MADTPESSTPSKLSYKLKSLMIQGAIGLVSLTGASAIPIIVQRVMTPPTPTVSPFNATTVAPVQAEVSPSSSPTDEPQSNGNGRGRDKEERRNRREK
ncbi:hypothetical protein H6G89_32415 [Oscillatoria sp. FACHB-1407]|uniref:hypothetical protein n=1 Tax=Oscillatoria sp. FACHB-1407 TaxID=2692847 RepID=UPI001684C714|nr:hypothetical protein [Oscillatoria sp. FACHB-1407]MBD2465695.1 hypothetical protein [Oscillatoria sp. FACHB-1407]